MNLRARSTYAIQKFRSDLAAPTLTKQMAVHCQDHRSPSDMLSRDLHQAYVGRAVASNQIEVHVEESDHVLVEPTVSKFLVGKPPKLSLAKRDGVPNPPVELNHN